MTPEWEELRKRLVYEFTKETDSGVFSNAYPNGIKRAIEIMDEIELNPLALATYGVPYTELPEMAKALLWYDATEAREPTE